MTHTLTSKSALRRFYSLCLALGLCISAASAAADDIGPVSKSAETVILRNPGTPPAGAKDADVILVEFFDYNCPFCKKLAPALQALLQTDPKVALVYKDWPILSDVSRYAARSALAAGWQGKYLVAHDVLMGASHLASSAQVDALLRAAGVDMQKLKQASDAHGAEIDALLRRNDTEVRALGIRGTPGLLVGRHIINGVYDVAGLEQAVAVARQEH
jgi:protein-disulfide isomerase